MPFSRSDIQQLYTKSIDRYASFIAAFQSPVAMQALLQQSNVLRNGLRVLDAGCGFGTATFALVSALRERKFDYESIDGFDLTPAMLVRFQREIETRGLSRIRLQEADVVKLDALPRSWTNYDLIISASMLEYLPRQQLPGALAQLQGLLTPNGRILVMVTRKTPETKVFIEWLWHAERYTECELRQAFGEAGFRNPLFRRFPWRYFWLNRANYVVEAAA